MFKLDVDSAAKVLTLEVQPKGEQEPLHLTIRGYKLTREDGRVILEYDGLSVSREWLEVLVNTLAPDKRLELPEGTPLELLKVLL